MKKSSREGAVYHLRASPHGDIHRVESSEIIPPTTRNTLMKCTTGYLICRMLTRLVTWTVVRQYRRITMYSWMKIAMLIKNALTI